MIKLPTQLFSKKGFTLVEMLVVVALLGALAVGLLAAIDPVEKIKQGRDESLRGISESYYNGILDYYSASSTMPFTVSSNAAPLTAAAMSTLTTTLINSNSLKSTFTALSVAQQSDVLVTTDIVNDTVAVCYIPDSRKQKLDAAAIYSSSGTAGTACGTTSSTCYYCIK